MKMIKDGQFVEYAHVHKNVYGTPQFKRFALL